LDNSIGDVFLGNIRKAKPHSIKIIYLGHSSAERASDDYS
jgi:hypothetical protein